MIWIILVCAIVFSGCQQQPQERHYTEIVNEEPQAAALTSSMDNDPHAGMDMASMGMGMGMGMDAGAAGGDFTWDLPDGWQQEPGKGFRLASFHLVSDEKAIDGSIVNLSGVAGGLEGNLKRWMGQIAMETSAEDLARLIANAAEFKIKALGSGKVFDFTTVQEKGKSADKSMIVVMVGLPESTLFVKMTGTISTMKAHKNDFLKLAASIKRSASPKAATPKMADMAKGATDPHAGMNMGDPHAGVDMSAMRADLPVPTQKLLDWEVPKGWKQGAGHPMRLGTFQLEGDPKAFDCSVILLGGDAGGVEANLSRWMGQVGVAPNPDNLKKALSKVQSIKTKGGLDANVYDISALQGDESSARSLMAGMISVGGSTIFIKMTGTAGVMRKEREHFADFIRSFKRI